MVLKIHIVFNSISDKKLTQFTFAISKKKRSCSRYIVLRIHLQGVLAIWIKVGPGPIVHAVGAVGGCLDIFFSCLSLLSSFSFSLGDGLIQTEILSQRAIQPTK